MILTRSIQQLDVNDGYALRVYYEALRGQLDAEFASWREHYRLLAQFVMPRQQRFNYADANRGDRLDLKIVDNTATLAWRTMRAGLMSGVCTPSRTWFNLLTSDDALNKRRNVKMYLEEVAKILRRSMLKTNFYQTAHAMLGELGLYGTSACQILDDDKDDVRYYPWPCGSYYLSGDDTQRIDLHMRFVQMTVRQIVDKFGYGNCSTAIQTLYDSNAGGVKETWFPVVNVIHRNRYFADRMKSERKPWVSIWYEASSYGNVQVKDPKQMGLLKRSGFDECPVISPRWDVIGEDFYGLSPGMDALGDVMGLQWLQRRKSQAVDKMINPPMIASPTMANQKMTILPGDITFANTAENNPGFRPAFQINYNVKDALEDIREHHDRIDEAFYKSLFMMISESDRRQVTAEEIQAKEREKMMILGPVVDRSNGEFLEPAIFRHLAILGRKGKLPPPPEEMKGKGIRVEFTSILAQAQKMLGLGNIERFMGLVGQEAAVNQGIFDIVDLDEMAREAGDLLSIPAKLLRDPAVVEKIKAAKDRQVQQAQQAENAQKLAQAAGNLASARTDQPNALTDLIHQQTGVAA